MRYRELIICRELGSESQHRAPFPNPGGQGEAKRGSVPGHAPNRSESRRTLGILRPLVMSRKPSRDCCPTSFNVLEVLFLVAVSSAFLPSKKACGAHQFRYWGVGQQYPS